MDVRSARHIVALARFLNFTRAADALGISQSALSRSIQQFERTSNVRLFDRTRGGVHLTVLGKAIAERATGLVREADDINRLIGRSAMGAQEDTAFGVGPLVAKALLPHVLAEALRGEPGSRNRVFIGNSETLLSMLLAEEIEFFTCAEGLLPPSAPVSSSLIVECRTIHVVRRGHPLLCDPSTSANAFPRVLSHSYEMRADPKELGKNSIVYMEDLTTCIALVEQTDAIWMTSDLAVSKEISTGCLEEVVIKNPSKQRNNVRQMFHCLTGRSLSPAALKFRKSFRSAALKIQKNNMSGQ